ncbi:hypothetical protein EMPS_04034 [Entomortierella parvispora]|uniref:Uncharacterized protein n=1 Tax=Entomortierella parvispora TaxID=205924 RepID=A0A9P3H7Q7_9FUNG|nr:hypothetical protein EMPS_04034 [Entomortierella parvispora]
MSWAFVDNKQSNWDQLFPSLEFAYNGAVNASTGYSLFFLNTGHSVCQATVVAVDSFLTEQATTLILAQDALQRAQDQQGEQAYKRRRDNISSKSMTNQVLLSAANITIPAHSTRPADKLRPQYIGPFILLEQHSPVTPPR